MPIEAKINLFTPLQVGDLKLRNRTLMLSLTRNRSPLDNAPDDSNRLYYVQRARYAGMVGTEGTLTSPQGTAWPHAAGIYSEEQAEAWKSTVKDVNGVGGVLICQLWHLGRVANNDMLLQKKAGKLVPAPSDLPCRGGAGTFERFGLSASAGYSVVCLIASVLTQITCLDANYRAAAQNAMNAGFDGVRLHGANQYLPHRFMDNTVNKRTDEWGNSVEGRCRFALEAVRAMNDVFDRGRVGIKLSPAGGANGIIDNYTTGEFRMLLEHTINTFSYLIKELVKLQIAFITLVCYSESGDPIIDGKKRGMPHDVLATYGPLVKNSPKTRRFLNGALTPQAAQTLVGSGQIDAAVFGILYITNPDLQRRIEQGKPLSTNYKYATFYYSGIDDPKGGYADWPDAE